MKVVIQCSATKDAAAGNFILNGRRVKFVAHPELHSKSSNDEVLFRPDDTIPSTSTTWRDHLLAYNRSGDNPDRLLRAADLYFPAIYRSLLHHVGNENFFILSAGWGLIKAGFLVPDYDITFSSQAEPWKRRTRSDKFLDFAQLTQADLRVGDQIYFFDGKDYLPLYYRLTRTLVARRVVYFASAHIPKDQEFEYIPYGTGGTNWHYRCARDFIEGRIAR
jgi:hypothetical protein